MADMHKILKDTERGDAARLPGPTSAMRGVAAARASVSPGTCAKHDHLIAVAASHGSRAAAAGVRKSWPSMFSHLRRYLQAFGTQDRIIRTHSGVGYSVETGHRVLPKRIAAGERGGSDAAPTVRPR